MASTWWKANTSNAYNSTLNGSIGSADTTITLNSVAGLQSPGVLVIDRTDGSGNATPTLREYISFTGISSNQLTGVTRGVAGSTAQAHNSGAQVEENMSVTHWNDMITLVTNEHDVAGHHVIATATINYTETKQLVTTSLASIQQLVIAQMLSASGASIYGNITDLSQLQVLSNKMLSSPTLVTPTMRLPIVIDEYNNGTFSANATVSWLNGDRQKGLLNTNSTFYFASMASGQVLTLWMYQDGTGGRSITLPTMRWPSALPPTFGSSASQVNAIIVKYDGQTFFGQSAVSFG